MTKERVAGGGRGPVFTGLLQVPNRSGVEAPLTSRSGCGDQNPVPIPAAFPHSSQKSQDSSLSFPSFREWAPLNVPSHLYTRE